MDFSFDLPEQYKALYGVKAESFGLQKDERRTALGDRLFRKAPHGYFFMPVNLGGIELWNPIMRMTTRKTVIETPMVERPGSVKEIISPDDWIINIRGIIKRPDGIWPDAELDDLNSMWLRNEAIPINSVMTSIFMNGEENVVITNLSIPDRPGQTEAVVYELEMTSDIKFDLEIDE